MQIEFSSKTLSFRGEAVKNPSVRAYGSYIRTADRGIWAFGTDDDRPHIWLLRINDTLIEGEQANMSLSAAVDLICAKLQEQLG